MTSRKHDHDGGVELARILAGEQHAPVVYFVRMGDNVKIGTSANLKARLRSFYLSLEDVLLLVPGGKDAEDAYHERFAASQIGDDGRQELFRIDGKLGFFLGLWRDSLEVPSQGLPLSLMPRHEIGDAPDLMAELLDTEGGGRGEWDAERVAELVRRLTYLSETASKDSPWHGHARMAAYYWHCTQENAAAEAQAARREALEESAWLPWWIPFRSRCRREAAEEAARSPQAHADRAAVIRDLFASALEPYEMSKQKVRAR